MSLPSIVAPPEPRRAAPSARPAGDDQPAALLAQSVLDEIYRRRNGIVFTLAMALILLAMAVGLRVWGPVTQAASDGPALGIPSTSSDLSGPTGTWQRWGDLDEEKLSQPRTATATPSSTTTFSASTPTTIPARTVQRLAGASAAAAGPEVAPAAP